MVKIMYIAQLRGGSFNFSINTVAQRIIKQRIIVTRPNSHQSATLEPTESQLERQMLDQINAIINYKVNSGYNIRQ